MPNSTTVSATFSAVSPSPLPSPLSSSPSFRLLSHLTLPPKHPDLTTNNNNNNNNNNSFEFNESDVVWSSSSSSEDEASELPSPSNVSTSPPVHRRSNSGLFAALSDDQHPSVRRKPAVSPSQSAATAARTIPPVTLRRSSDHYHQSAPVNVPVWPRNRTTGYLGFDDVSDDVAEEEEDGEIVPPHEIVARSYVTFSVFEGAGRTLKGRDLCRVRNAVFRKTGFLD